jgi:hypothetical protein
MSEWILRHGGIERPVVTPEAEIEALLRLYASRRLRPRYGAMWRIRSAVYRHAERRVGGAGSRGVAWTTRLARGVVAAGLAVSFALGVGMVVVEAVEGGHAPPGANQQRGFAR